MCKFLKHMFFYKDEMTRGPLEDFPIMTWSSRWPSKISSVYGCYFFNIQKFVGLSLDYFVLKDQSKFDHSRDLPVHLSLYNIFFLSAIFLVEKMLFLKSQINVTKNTN